MLLGISIRTRLTCATVLEPVPVPTMGSVCGNQLLHTELPVPVPTAEAIPVSIAVPVVDEVEAPFME